MHGAVAGAELARRQGAGRDMMRHGLAIASALLEVGIVVLIFCVALGEVPDGLPLANRWQAFVCGVFSSGSSPACRGLLPARRCSLLALASRWLAWRPACPNGAGLLLRPVFWATRRRRVC